jgi:hypothetical protein
MHIQAGTVTGGMTLSKRPYTPVAIKCRMFTSRLSSKIISGAAQSSPNTHIFIFQSVENQEFVIFCSEL